MKKLLVAVLAFALFAPAFAVENVQVTGDIQTIGLSYNDRGTGIGFAGTGENLKGTTNRVLLGLEADLVEDVQARLTFAHENVFGMGPVAYPAPYVSGESLDDVWANTYVAEAYVKISNIFDALEVKVGRQFYGDEKSPVIYFGPDYGYAIGNAYLSLDGATVRYNGENFALTAAYFSLANDNGILVGAYPTTGEDMNLGGLDLDVKINENITASAYIYEFENEANATLPAGVSRFGFWGVKPTIEYEHFKLGAEYTRNYSLGNDKGWQVKADLALPIGNDDTTITPRVTYLKSEKHFAAFGNYRPGLMFGTLNLAPINHVFGPVNNWEILNAGVCMKFASLEKVGFGLDFYTGEMDGAFVGNSWEAKAVYNHNEYVALNLTGAILTNVGHSWKHSPTAVQLGMNIKF